MSDFILEKQDKKDANKTTVTTMTTSGRLFLKPLLVLVVLLGFIVMSVNHNNLFLVELLVASGITILVSLVHILQK